MSKPKKDKPLKERLIDIFAAAVKQLDERASYKYERKDVKDGLLRKADLLNDIKEALESSF